jgi:hypothetical protein
VEHQGSFGFALLILEDNRWEIFIRNYLLFSDKRPLGLSIFSVRLSLVIGSVVVEVDSEPWAGREVKFISRIPLWGRAKIIS